ncbi:MAG: nucleotidyltransferase family protein [Terracidiphilus sp.]|nr:nucleotidyltransferase family protein [Terracidiphilus sp.]
MTSKWKTSCIKPAAPIAEALRTIDESSLQIALVVEDTRLCGTLTDGDVRRAMLKGITLNDPVSKAMNPNPKTAFLGDSRELLVARMRQLRVRHMPIVDSNGALAGLEVVDEMLSQPALMNQVVIMAGGYGRRLSPLTDDCPKPMLSIGGCPILETVLLNFIEYGFRNFSIAVNYKAEMIINYFGDGAKWGVNIEYLRESKPLGTAGALSLLKERRKLPIVLMNGDILTKVNFNHLLEFHAAQDSKATMCVRDYQFQVPYGVVKVDGYQILEIQEKPTHKFFVNAGIYVLDPDILGLLLREEPIDMTDLFDRVMEAKWTHAVFPVREYWVDIGQHSDLDRATGEFEMNFR